MADLSDFSDSKRPGYYDMTCIRPGCFGKITRPPVGQLVWPKCSVCWTMYGETMLMSMEIHDLERFKQESP
jgi:hypothetical protein